MGRQVVRVAREIPIGFVILLWVWIIMWRFFTGAHMNGQKYFDTLFWKDASVFHRRKQTSFAKWKRTKRVKRMWIRNAIFWPAAFLAYGWYTNPDIMVIVTLWSSPLWGYFGFFYLRKTFFELHRAGFGEGQVRTFWVLKRRYRWMRFEWLLGTPNDEPSVVVKSAEDDERGDIKIISLKTLMDPQDDEAWTKGGDA